jgi:hypothetical protein
MIAAWYDFFGSMLTQVGKYQIVEKIGVGGFAGNLTRSTSFLPSS